MIQNIPICKQGDPRWSSQVMAPSKLTLAEAGCLESCVAMGLKNYSIDEDPGVLNARIVSFGGYAADGNLTLKAIEHISPWIKFYERINTTNNTNAQLAKMQIETALARVARALRLGCIVALNVSNGGHWVLAVETQYVGSNIHDFLINDPLYGDQVLYSSRYGDPRTTLWGYLDYIGPAQSTDGGRGPGEAATADYVARGMMQLALDALMAPQ